MEKQAREVIPARSRPSVSSRRSTAVAVLAVLSLLSLCFHGSHSALKHGETSVVEKVQKCAISNLHDDLSFLDPAKPITVDEFIDRHDRLAHALAASDIDAFVLEPGYTFQ